MICSCPEHVELRRSGKKHVECCFNGRRLHEAWPRVQSMIERVRARAYSLRLDDTEGDNRIFVTTRSMLMKLASLLNYRMKYLSAAPWSFSRCDTVEGSEFFLSQVEAHPLENHDPLTRHLVEKLSDQIRARANGSDLDPAHWEEVRRIRLSCLDEGVGEGYHRSTTRELTRATGSSAQHLKQSVRGKSCLKTMKFFLKKYGKRAEAVFCYDWRNFKRILRTSPAKRWQPVRMRTRAFYARLYREDDMAGVDWNQAVCRQGNIRLVQRIPAGTRQAMYDEYIAAQLQAGRHFLIPLQEQVEQDLGSEPVMQEKPYHFEVLSIAYGRSRMKALHTVESADDPSLFASLAVEVQPATVRIDAHGEAAGAGEHLFPSGDSKWIEPHNLCEGKIWENRLLVYKTVEPSSLPGCITVSDPVLCKPPYGVLEDKCPTLAVVKHNFAHGWKAVHRRIDHTQAIVGDCDASEAIKFKQYHQCLATLSHCLQFTSHLPSRQCQNYYRCLLRGIHAEPNLSSKSYAALLIKDAKTNGGALAIEDGLQDDAIAIEDLPHMALDNGDGILLPQPERDLPPPKLERPSVPRAGAMVVGDSSSSRDAAPIQAAATASGDGDTSGNVGAVDGSIDDGIIVNSAGAQGEDDVLLAPASSHHRSGQSKTNNVWLPSIDGFEVAFREYVTPAGKEYRNYRLKCLRHDDCIKTKGEVESLVRRCGIIGPLAFLHAWANMDDTKSEKTHVNQNPKIADVQAVASSRRDELTQIVERLHSQ